MAKRTTKRVERKAEPRKPAVRDDSVEDIVKGDRERLLRLVRDAGLEVEERSAFLKVASPKDRKLRMYVAKRGPQVHFTFPVRGAEAISEAEAKKRHIGSVRSILFLDRQKSDVLKGVFSEAIRQLR